MTNSEDSAAADQPIAVRRRRSDAPFFLIMSGLSACFVLLIALLIAADLAFTSFAEFKNALLKPEIQAAFKLTIISCTLAAILSLWVGTPLGYLLSRYKFPGRWLVDTIVDIPIVLPPLVLGLSLLILFHLPIGATPITVVSTDDSGNTITSAETNKSDDDAQSPVPPTCNESHDGTTLTGKGEPGATITLQDSDGNEIVDSKGAPISTTIDADGRWSVKDIDPPIGGWELESWLRDDIGFPVTFQWPAVILAQFAVACAFAVRTMRVTFDQIDPRAEDVARTLGCTRGQAFMRIALPQAGRGMIAAATIAWARALGEFGPILVFAGSTRMKTEVLSTTVFLELSIGNLDAAVAVSLLMVAMATVVLVILRSLGSGITA